MTDSLKEFHNTSVRFHEGTFSISIEMVIPASIYERKIFAR